MQQQVKQNTQTASKKKYNFFKAVMLAIAVYLLWLAYKFYQAYNYLIFGFGSLYIPDFNSKKIKDIALDWADGYGQIGLELELANFSTKEFTILNYYIELYTPDGRFVAMPENPAEIKALRLQPKNKTPIKLTYGVDVAGLTKFFEQIPGYSVIDKALLALNNYKIKVS